ncbi:hypothetical protein HHI36_013964 [Cryptolaemus montrouzieri]
MEAPCAMAPSNLPLNAKPRHLFLFNDVLLVAKPRSPGTFKLKERVRVSEIWLHRHPESETGFLLGWPSPARTYLVSFCTQAARDSWWRELKQALSTQLRLEPPTTNIKVVFRDPLSGTECSKTVGVRPETSSGEVARLTLDETGNQDCNFTLYARDKDNAPCPLVGYERPHSIQLARIRQSMCAEEGFDLTHCNNNRIPSDIVFELKPNIKPPPRKSHLKLFRTKSGPRMFGVCLSRLCTNNSLPPVIAACLKALFVKGPHVQGIFRRCASARALRELREKVDAQTPGIVEEISSNTHALLLAALLKEFLRSLPEPLLAGNAQEWLYVGSNGRMDKLRKLLALLPAENYLLLTNVICVLYNIAKKAKYNLMSAANLAVCLGPSLLWESSPNSPMRTLPTLVETLITQCQVLFGTQIVSMLGEVQNDSGAEESDSLHSLGLSLDSAELSKDQKSLSRDSGLTLSEDDRESPGLNMKSYSFHRQDWSRQAARMRSLDNTWVEEDEAFCTSNESLCSPPIPPRRHLPLRHIPQMHLPPLYRPPPPPPPTYAARLMLVTDSESESYV